MWNGIEIALTGMGIVFTFLILLISFTTLMSKLVTYFDNTHCKKEDVQSVHEKVHNIRNLNGTMSDEILIKVISAAIQQHRSGKIKQ